MVITLKAEDIIYSYLNKGLCDIGICKAEGFEEEREVILAVNSSLKGFVEQDIEKRIYPSLTMPEAKSIISASFPYIKKMPVKDAGLRVRVSMGAVGEDYHISLKRILEDMAHELEDKFNAACKVFVDTGPLSDRAVALKSGIGYIGKNGSLVSKNGGSGVFLGYILTDLELEKTDSVKEDCGSCKKCIISCPAGALSEEGFCMEKCISYITQKKGMLTEKEMALMGTDIFGCDVCHRVCPKTRVTDEQINKDDIFPLAEEILALDNKGFKERFGNSAVSFRGRNIIRRNVICALSNIKTEESLALIKKYINDDSELVSKTALTALEMMEK